MPQIQVATSDDLTAWLTLAAEVEPLFGPLVEDESFLDALKKNLARGSATCYREGDGPAGNPLLAGLLFSPKGPNYRLSWLAVTERLRGQGMGTALINNALSLFQPPGTVTLVTFGSDSPHGVAVRKLYFRLGFVAGKMTAPGPEGGSRQLFHLKLPSKQQNGEPHIE